MSGGSVRRKQAVGIYVSENGDRELEITVGVLSSLAHNLSR